MKGKAILKKWWLWVIVVCTCVSILSSGGESENTTDESEEASFSTAETAQAPSLEEVNEPVEETPEIELSNDFEKDVWQIVKNNEGNLVSIESVVSEESDETTVIAAVLCKNDENVVNTMLSEISEVIRNNDTNESGIFTFGDIEEDEDAPVLVMAGVYSDGTIDVSSTSNEYNSERNRWIQSQFSLWDGAHTELEKLIISNLNDEKSYEHIKTTYRDIATESARDEINQILEAAGYSQRVEVEDLFIQTVFSAKNAFGGVVKNTAFGIASYQNKTITLIAIEG